LSNWGLHPEDDPLKILQRLSCICHVRARSLRLMQGWASWVEVTCGLGLPRPRERKGALGTAFLFPMRWATGDASWVASESDEGDVSISGEEALYFPIFSRAIWVYKMNIMMDRKNGIKWVKIVQPRRLSKLLT
jgi:hypothetical protein